MADIGRPTAYTPEIAAAICERMANGESLRSICREEGMPAESTVRLWHVEDREGFSAQYTKAREAQMDALAEDILDIADDVSLDWKKTANGAEVVDSEVVARSRLRVDTRKWLMSKIAPKRFGDRVVHAGDPENPIETKDHSSRELAVAIARLLAKGNASA
jgi:hypothetical protein